LRAIREGTGKSLKQLQRTIHVSDSSLSRYLSGRTLPPWDVVEGLCRDAGHPADAIHTLRALWEQAQRERYSAEHSLEASPRPPAMTSSASADVGRRDAGGDVMSDLTPQAMPPVSGASGVGCRAGTVWWRPNTAAGLAMQLTGAALLFGSLGLWAGASLKHPATIVVTKSAV
jgi:transcriptional regulator with XRE-family HTH domain